MILTFDLDNTITPHKQPISNSMYFLLKRLNTTHRIWIVTASTARLARQQLGPLFNEVERVYCCSGAERWEGGKLIEFKEWLPANPRQVVTSLNEIVSHSEFPIKHGSHIDVRTGAISLSLPGNNANTQVKTAYQSWDRTHHERDRLCKLINEQFEDIQANKSGQVSILITPTGAGKHIILEQADDTIWFWGDETRDNGNDASLAEAVRKSGGRVFAVDNPEHTYAILNEVLVEQDYTN